MRINQALLSIPAVQKNGQEGVGETIVSTQDADKKTISCFAKARQFFDYMFSEENLFDLQLAFSLGLWSVACLSGAEVAIPVGGIIAAYYAILISSNAIINSYFHCKISSSP